MKKQCTAEQSISILQAAETAGNIREVRHLGDVHQARQRSHEVGVRWKRRGA